MTTKPAFCFLQRDNGEQVAVNARLVRFVAKSGFGAMVVFDNDHKLAVKGTVEDVVRKLADAE